MGTLFGHTPGHTRRVFRLVCSENGRKRAKATVFQTVSFVKFAWKSGHFASANVPSSGTPEKRRRASSAHQSPALCVVVLRAWERYSADTAKRLRAPAVAARTRGDRTSSWRNTAATAARRSTRRLPTHHRHGNDNLVVQVKHPSAGARRSRDRLRTPLAIAGKITFFTRPPVADSAKRDHCGRSEDRWPGRPDQDYRCLELAVEDPFAATDMRVGNSSCGFRYPHAQSGISGGWRGQVASSGALRAHAPWPGSGTSREAESSTQKQFEKPSR